MSDVNMEAVPLRKRIVAALLAPVKLSPREAAARRMRRGKGLVISGFIVAVAGVVGYCLASFRAAEPGAWTSGGDPAWLPALALGVVGLGTLLWLVGSCVFLIGAMDSDPQGPDINF